MHKRLTTLILILVTLQLGITAGSAYSSNLQAYYPMNHTSGSIVDYSGNGNDGSASGSISRGVSICNTGSSCDINADLDWGSGNNDAITVPDSSSLDITGDVTISAWVNMQGTPSFDVDQYADDAYGGTQYAPGRDCESIDDIRSPSDGNYWIDPDGLGGVAPFQVRCEMGSDGGGWIQLDPSFAYEGGDDIVVYAYSGSNTFTKCGDHEDRYVDNYAVANGGEEDFFDSSYGRGWYDVDFSTAGNTLTEAQESAIRSRVTHLSDYTELTLYQCDTDGKDPAHETQFRAEDGSTFSPAEGSSDGDYSIASEWFVLDENRKYMDSTNGIHSNGGPNYIPDKYLMPHETYYVVNTGGGGLMGYERAYMWLKESNSWSKTDNGAYYNVPIGITKRSSYGMYFDSNSLYATFNGNKKVLEANSPDDLSNSWNHVMMTFDNSEDTVQIYVNGDLAGETTWTGTPNANNNPLTIGNLPAKFSDVRVYDTALTPSDFAQEYSNMRTDGNQVNGLRANMINQTGEVVKGADVWLEKAGSDQLVCPNLNYNKTDANGNVLFPPLDQTKIYDLFFQSSNYQNEFVFRNVRVPDLIEAGYNQNFVPESTMSNSLKFSAGHVLPAQTLITRPFSDFDVVNVSVEKTLDPSYRMVSDILVRKYNVDFESGWQSWSNRKTVTVQDIYNRNWDDSGGEMNHAWGIITFNPEGFQNNDCSDVRLTDKNNNVQDFTVNTCQDDYVELEFNAPIDALQEKEFYIYYGNSGASDAQTAVQRPSETRQFDMETGVTGTADTYVYQDNSGGTKEFNVTIPQNIDFIERSMTVEGDRIKPKTNNLPVSLDTDYQDFTGMEVEPKRPYILQGIDIQMANTTVDSEFVIRNMTSGNNILVRDIPNNDGGEYFFNYTNESIQRAGENLVFRPGHKFLMFVRYGEARRASSTETQRPMFNLTDTVFHRQFFSLNSDGTGGTEGDYPVLVSQIDTIDPEYPTNVTITHENTGQQVYNGPDQLNDQQTVDLTSYLDAVDWREGDPLDNPKLHEFTVESDTDGNLSMTFDTRVEFEHPVTTVSKTASGCSVNPETQTYFHIDRSDCSYLDRVNVSQGQWFRLDYRFRTPGPNDFDAPGDTNSYNISDTMVRFDILQETEEFTTG